MKTQCLYLLATLWLTLCGCKRIDDTIFPLAGNWKPAADRITRIQYISGGKSYNMSFAKMVAPSSTLLVFGKDGTYTEGTAGGSYALETINGEKRVVLTTTLGNKTTFTYELADTNLKLGLVSLYEDMTAADRLAVGKALGLGLSSAVFPGISTATNVQKIVVTYTYTKQ